MNRNSQVYFIAYTYLSNALWPIFYCWSALLDVCARPWVKPRITPAPHFPPGPTTVLKVRPPCIPNTSRWNWIRKRPCFFVSDNRGETPRQSRLACETLTLPHLISIPCRCLRPHLVHLPLPSLLWFGQSHSVPPPANDFEVHTVPHANQLLGHPVAGTRHYPTVVTILESISGLSWIEYCTVIYRVLHNTWSHIRGAILRRGGAGPYGHGALLLPYFLNRFPPSPFPIPHSLFPIPYSLFLRSRWPVEPAPKYWDSDKWGNSNCRWKCSRLSCGDISILRRWNQGSVEW